MPYNERRSHLSLRLCRLFRAPLHWGFSSLQKPDPPSIELFLQYPPWCYYARVPFFRYHYLDVLILVLSTFCGITFIAGAQTLFFVCYFPSPVGSRIHPRSSIKNAAINCPRLRVYLSFHFPVYWLSNVSSTTHRMLSHLALALSHSWTSYKLERRSPKLYKKATTVG
ncbi:hypothetical protein EDB84DRAFT_331753 [Lactarius hengduanensis]|nr:hypothetical protein EDB84DRAFT_331753 [Lactarius hengduanensis]